ncbi:MAG TPA: RidA family protein, partial [Burkholderiales bacterium]|nr:RidA family protein [Burkholderiales bacterium]
SQAVAVPSKGVMVFVSGMTARRPDGTIAGIGDVEAQTRQVCENIKSALEAAGGSMDAVNKVRRQFFPSPPPASTLVEVSKLVSPEFLVEISAIAVISS